MMWRRFQCQINNRIKCKIVFRPLELILTCRTSCKPLRKTHRDHTLTYIFCEITFSQDMQENVLAPTLYGSKYLFVIRVFHFVGRLTVVVDDGVRWHSLFTIFMRRFVLSSSILRLLFRETKARNDYMLHLMLQSLNFTLVHIVAFSTSSWVLPLLYIWQIFLRSALSDSVHEYVCTQCECLCVICHSTTQKYTKWWW